MKKPFDFIGHRKLFTFIALGVLAFGIICNIIFGVQLDISFKGGTLIKYSYTGTLDKDTVDNFITGQLGKEVTIQESVSGDLEVLNVSLTDTLTTEQLKSLENALKEQFPDNNVTSLESSSLLPSMGKLFLIKCLVAIALASVFLLVYVGFRFRKIGGVSAGAFALLALLNDLVIAYFAFVVFRIPLDDNFVAVLLAILGYSLNDTIVIYDRVRENRAKMDSKTPISEIVNLSINQSFTRSFNTSVCTFIAVATVAVMALALNLDSIVSFAVPMMFGVISGFYTSTCLCTPLWAVWVEHKQKKPAKSKK